MSNANTQFINEILIEESKYEAHKKRYDARVWHLKD